MPAPALPPELIGLIVEAVDARDSTTLKACSLSALAFRKPAQKRLHEHVSVTSDHAASTALLERLERHPHLATYVRKLTIKLTRSANIPALRATTASLFSLLVGVRQVHISSLAPRWPISGDSLPWRDIVELGVAAWLLELGAAGRLQILSLRNVVDIPSSALPVLASAKQLEVCLSTMSSDETHASNSYPENPVRLSQLSTICSPSIAKILLHPELHEYTKHLRTLHFCWPEALEADLSSCGALQNIVYTVPLPVRDAPTPPTSKPFCADIEAYGHIVDFLVDTLKNTPALRRFPLTLVFQYPLASPSPQYSELEAEFNLDPRSCRDLDAALATHPTLTEVQCVAQPLGELGDGQGQGHGLYLPFVCEGFERALPRTAARRLFSGMK